MICPGQQMLTIQLSKLIKSNPLNGSKKSFLFKVNSQYCYGSTVIRTEGCGCGGSSKKNVKYYLVIVDGYTYEIPEDIAVESTVEIATESQDFDHQRNDVFLQNKEHTDFSQINNNCTNCNSDIPHGDYNNFSDTGGRKDPQLTGQ